MDWLTAIDRYGLPIVGLLAFALLFWRLIQWARNQFDWAKKHVVEPVVAGHLKFLEKTAESQTEQGVTLKRIADAQDRQTELMGQIACLNGRPRE